MRRDDEFLDALSAGGYLPPADDGEAHLGSLLYAWRAETLAPPPPAPLTLNDVDIALAAQNARAAQAADGTRPDRRATAGGRDKQRNRGRHLRLLSGAAAITAVAAAGLLVLSENSQPGDPLWNVKKVVFSQAAAQTEATIDVQHGLERAEQALAAGDSAAAVALVNDAEANLKPVSDPETRERMETWIRRLRGEGSKVRPPTQPDGQVAPDPQTLVPLTTQVPSQSTSEGKEETAPPTESEPEESAPSSSEPPKSTKTQNPGSSTVTTTTTSTATGSTATRTSAEASGSVGQSATSPQA
ncbi:anti-sigma-D factor RsdA [Gordonia hirsuta]|uniref:anti-sigma-D factor RsdA n=1 Tax=Gordonia hirsuta TaxID=53427 RepID=UPI0012DD08E4|nr:anti-sigma-D factor RsdA [Gordonia hirsuta]